MKHDKRYLTLFKTEAARLGKFIDVLQLEEFSPPLSDLARDLGFTESRDDLISWLVACRDTLSKIGERGFRAGTGWNEVTALKQYMEVEGKITKAMMGWARRQANDPFAESFDSATKKHVMGVFSSNDGHKNNMIMEMLLDAAVDMAGASNRRKFWTSLSEVPTSRADHLKLLKRESVGHTRTSP